MTVTRQMKTITYSLASTKCMDEGWTVKPLTPIPDDSSSILDPFVIEVNPIQQVGGLNCDNTVVISIP